MAARDQAETQPSAPTLVENTETFSEEDEDKKETSTWAQKVQKSVKKTLSTSQAAVTKSVQQAADTVDAGSSLTHAGRVVGFKEGGALGYRLNVEDAKVFAKRMTKLSVGTYSTKMRQIAKMKFKLLDLNGDGVIDQEEIAIVMGDLGVLWHVFGEGDPQAFFKDCDKNNDGVISREEFIKSFSAASFAKAFIE